MKGKSLIPRLKIVKNIDYTLYLVLCLENHYFSLTYFYMKKIKITFKCT